MDEVAVIILLDEAADLLDMKRECELRGLARTQSLDRMHVLKGFIDRSRVPEIAAVPGVVSVEPERIVRISKADPPS